MAELASPAVKSEGAKYVAEILFKMNSTIFALEVFYSRRIKRMESFNIFIESVKIFYWMILANKII